MPVLLHQFQQLRYNKKNQLNLIDQTKISSEMMKNYRFNKKREGFNKMELVNLRKNLQDQSAEDEDSESEKNRTRTYRQSFRMSYKKHLNVLVRYQYKL